MSAAAASEFIEAYNIAGESCALLGASNTETQTLRNNHRSLVTDLVISRTVLQGVSATAGAAKDCASTLAGADKSTPWGAVSGAVATAGACIAGAVQAGADIAALGLGAKIETAQLAHDNSIADVEATAALNICRNDARLHLVGATRAGIDLEQAVFDLNHAHGSLAGILGEAQRRWAAGHAYLAEIEGAVAPPPSGELWTEEAVETFVRQQRLARRATYLALRAVEYEQQQTLALRADVFDAATPDELRAVLEELWTGAATRTVGGSRPSDLHVVLSLRDDILRIEDDPVAPGVQSLTAEGRFRVMLSDPRYAVYDDDGEWRGQRIPFELIPQGALGFEVGAVPIYADTDCAERIWGVNASIVGTDVMNGSEASFVRVDLLKRNTFFSQWCGAAPDGQPFQTASTRPTRNLFREPGLGESVGGNLGSEYDITTETRARIQAFLGVTRAELEDPRYGSGETTELAARGLFGEYALFIPAAFIAHENTEGEYSTGLVLDRIDDVLLRFDYVSVAR